MSDRNWGILAAFAGIAALVSAAGFGAFYGSVYSAERRHYQSVGPNSGQTYPADSPRNGLADISGVDRLAESLIAKPQPRNAQERQDRDLAAQEAMAVFGYWVFWAMIAQTVFAAGALVALVKDLRQNRRTAEAQLRAYVSLHKWEYSAPGGNACVTVTLKNFGQTPARRVEYICQLTPDPNFTHDDLVFVGAHASDIYPHDIWENLGSNSRHLLDTLNQKMRFVGEIRYSDVFGVRWADRISFCQNDAGEWRTESNGNYEYRIGPDT